MIVDNSKLGSLIPNQMNEDSSSFIIANKYHVTAFLGKGGFGNTYGAFDIYTNQEVAIKIEKDQLHQIPQGSQRRK